MAATWDEGNGGRLLVFGGWDGQNVGHTDVWELNVVDGTWAQRMTDCAGQRCPVPSLYPALFATPPSGGASTGIAIYPSDDPRGVLHYTARPGEGWRDDLDPEGGPCEDGEAWQPGTNLCWQRCPVGQAWNGWDCEGTAAKTDWYDAAAACNGDLALPTKPEMESLLGGCEDHWLWEICEPCSSETVCDDMLGEESASCPFGARRYWTSTGQGTTQWWSWAWWGSLEHGLIAPARKSRECGMNARCVREVFGMETE